MIERRVRRADRAYAAAQIYLEARARAHGLDALVLATEDGAPLAGVGSESDLTAIGALAARPEAARHVGVRAFAVVARGLALRVAATGALPERECARDLARILARA
jgi:hypothetical protein